MKLSEVKQQLEHLDKIRFRLPDGSYVPDHFHVTEIGFVTKVFLDCGATARLEERASFQLWTAKDYDHRLTPKKFLSIIETSQVRDLEVEVEYQTYDTIGKYGLDFDETDFLLTTKQTDCLAKDKCGIPEDALSQECCVTSCC